jgi:hypothetical protein
MKVTVTPNPSSPSTSLEVYWSFDATDNIPNSLTIYEYDARQNLITQAVPSHQYLAARNCLPALCRILLTITVSLLFMETLKIRQPGTLTAERRKRPARRHLLRLRQQYRSQTFNLTLGIFNSKAPVGWRQTMLSIFLGAQPARSFIQT